MVQYKTVNDYTEFEGKVVDQIKVMYNEKEGSDDGLTFYFTDGSTFTVKAHYFGGAFGLNPVADIDIDTYVVEAARSY